MAFTFVIAGLKHWNKYEVFLLKYRLSEYGDVVIHPDLLAKCTLKSSKSFKRTNSFENTVIVRECYACTKYCVILLHKRTNKTDQKIPI